MNVEKFEQKPMEATGKFMCLVKWGNIDENSLYIEDENCGGKVLEEDLTEEEAKACCIKYSKEHFGPNQTFFYRPEPKVMGTYRKVFANVQHMKRMSFAFLIIGALSLLYLIFADSLTMVKFGWSKEFQLHAQRFLTIVIYESFFLVFMGSEFVYSYYEKFFSKNKVVKAIRFALLIILPVFLTLATLNTPFWSFQSPFPDRPEFLYGWPVFWKGETGAEIYLFGPMVNFIMWSGYSMVFLGYVKRKPLLIWGVVMAVLSALYGALVGFETIYR